MGKKRVAKKGATGKEAGAVHAKSPAKLSRKKLESGVLSIHATYNNTKLLLADADGKAVTWSSSGSLGFKGARKGTPFAAAKIGEAVGERARVLGIREIDIVIKGVGSGRESSVRGFLTTSGAHIRSIQDRTPIPFNGPRSPKPRRV